MTICYDYKHKIRDIKDPFALLQEHLDFSTLKCLKSDITSTETNPKRRKFDWIGQVSFGGTLKHTS